MAAASTLTDPLDHRFWRSMYERHATAVLRFLQGRLGCLEDAEDLLQETFVRAIRAGTVRPDTDARAYLVKTANNLLINRFRRPRLVVAIEGGERAEGWLENVRDSSLSPETEVSWRRFREQLEDVLSAMSEAHRTAFHLAILQQRSYSDIAQMTGWSISGVKINVFRARKIATRELAEHLPVAAKES